MEAVRTRLEHALALDAEHVPALAGYAHALVYEADRTEPGALRDAVLRRANQVSLCAVTLRPDDADAAARGPTSCTSAAIWRRPPRRCSAACC